MGSFIFIVGDAFCRLYTVVYFLVSCKYVYTRRPIYYAQYCIWTFRIYFRQINYVFKLSFKARDLNLFSIIYTYISRGNNTCVDLFASMQNIYYVYMKCTRFKRIDMLINVFVSPFYVFNKLLFETFSYFNDFV